MINSKENSIFDIYTEEQLKESKTNRLIENLDNMKDKDFFTFEEIEDYIKQIKETKTIEDLSRIEIEISNKRKFVIGKNGLITNVLDHREKNMLTDITKDECIKMINSVNNLKELEKVEQQIEEVIKLEGSKIIDEYNSLLLKYNFEEKKVEYLNKLKGKVHLIKENDIFDEETLKILLNPKNPVELEYSEGVLSFIVDALDMKNPNYKLDYSNSLFLKVLIELYNAYNSGEADINMFNKYNNVESVAKLSYEILYINLKGEYELREAFKRQTGVNLKDEIESMKFNIFLKEISNSLPQTNCKFDEENMENTVKFFKEFHRVCLDNKTEDIYNRRR